jgi:hypothetical protein
LLQPSNKDGASSSSSTALIFLFLLPIINFLMKVI